MNWEVIGIVCQVASAIAIVVTLIYLASQNRQANVTAATSATVSGNEMASNWRAMLVTNADLADALARANTDMPVSPAERTQLNYLFDDLFILTAVNYAHGFQTGSVHAPKAPVDYALLIINDNAAAASQWRRIRQFLDDISPEFIVAVEARMAA